MSGSSPPEGPPRLVCRCLGVSSLRIASAVRGGAHTVDEIQEQLPAGLGCSSCRPEIEEIIAAVRGLDYPADLKEQNRRSCQEGCERRIANAVYGALALRLPEDVTLELVSIQGLIVDLHLEGANKSMQVRVAAKLRQIVCPDLLVVFS
jgi:bacterioferritin-associated ferredoxin